MRRDHRGLTTCGRDLDLSWQFPPIFSDANMRRIAINMQRFLRSDDGPAAVIFVVVIAIAAALGGALVAFKLLDQPASQQPAQAEMSM